MSPGREYSSRRTACRKLGRPTWKEQPDDPRPSPAGPGPARDPRSASPLHFGFAKRAITPALGAKPVYLAGFDNDRKATGVHDDLWARAVAVGDGRQKIAIVSVDLIGFFHADVLKARERLLQQGPRAPP